MIEFPLELQLHIINFLPIKDSINLALTCRTLEGAVFNKNNLRYRMVEIVKKELAHAQQQINKPKGFLKKIKAGLKKPQIFDPILYFRKCEDQNFFSGSPELQELKLELRIRPPVNEALKEMKTAALASRKDDARFVSLAPYVLPYVKEDSLVHLYADAIGTLRKETINKMLKIKKPDPEKYHYLQPILSNRAKRNPEFIDYMKNGLTAK
jgi:hypothetical protein